MNHYDVIIVGAGFAGSILAKQLGAAGRRVLVLESGEAESLTPEGYRRYVKHYYEELIKVPNAPYPENPNAPFPTVLTSTPPIPPGQTIDTGYLVQKGPHPFGSDYVRNTGGTSLHWLGTALRLCPSDFRLRSRYGQGVDWPITYDDLSPDYARAEAELGVAAEVSEQAYNGIRFPDGYVYPMHKIPESHLDEYLRRHLDGLRVRLGRREYPVSVTSTPQARNGIPNPRFRHPDTGKVGHEPVGMVGEPHTGERCAGNSSCIPICPIQAKYNATKTLAAALAGSASRVHLETKSVVSRLSFDPASGRVSGVEYQRYHQRTSTEHTVHRASATIYVLAGNAIENARLMLASGAPNTSGQLGANLMDHPFQMAWARLRDRVGMFRGPSATTGIETLRDGEFRMEHAAFRAEITNWGWDFAAGAPYSDVAEAVDQANLFGVVLRHRLADRVPRQLRLGALLEQLPSAANRVTVDPAYRDQLGNLRPVIRYGFDDYLKAGAAAFKRVMDQVFQRLGAEQLTAYDPAGGGSFVYRGQNYLVYGAGHLLGTHRMGRSAADSVTDADMRCWDHPNLFLVGGGAFPTIATANPTLTISALAFRAARAIHGSL